MKLKFEGDQETEQEQEQETEDNLKIPQNDQNENDIIMNEQIKIDEMKNLKDTVNFVKIIIFFLALFCIFLILLQLFQDFQIKRFQKQIKILKSEIDLLKSNHDSIKTENNVNIPNLEEKKFPAKTSNNNNSKDKDCNDDLTNKQPNYFSAETITLKEKFTKEILFLKDCMLDTNIKLFIKVDEPKISIVIPLYKKEANINRLMQSIQKQEMNEIEIIFMEDSRNTAEFPKLEEISKKDKRIVILKNEKNKGVLNAYVQSILKVKSKYFIFLEEEGMLLPYLNQIYNLTQSYDKDIYEFSNLKGSINGITFNEKIDDVEKVKEEIAESYYNENFIKINPLLNKIYKTEFAQKAVKGIKEFYFDEKFELHADSLLHICLCNNANSYKSFGNYYGEYHIMEDFHGTVENIEKMFNSTLYLARYLYELKYEAIEIFDQRCILIINLLNWPLNYNIKMHIDAEEAIKVINLFANNKNIGNENKRKMNLIIRKINDRKMK